MAAKKKEQPKQIRNRQAFYEYEILEKFEAGIVLMGSEVKSIREGKVTFVDSYARIVGGEVFLVSLHIGEYKNAMAFGHDATRKRKLLLHNREIGKLQKRVEQKGLTLVPLRMYFTARALVKVELGLGRGKQLHDKRKTIKDRDSMRDVQREMSRYER